MVFVEAIVCAFSIARLHDHPAYAAGAGAVGVTCVWLTYRAGVASARVYGLILVEIRRRYPAPS